MKIRVLKNPRFDKIMRSLSFRVIEEENVKVTYEGIFGFKVDMEQLGLNRKEFFKFYQELTVDGGRKKRVGTALIVTPKRERTLSVRLSEDEYRDLQKMAEMEGRSVEDLFRELAVVAVAQRRGM